MKWIWIILAILTISCKPDDRPDDTRLAVATIDRFQVQVVGTFPDDLAYQKYRSIYVLIDKNTGQQFVGISGVGIAELGSHKAGRSSAPDER